MPRYHLHLHNAHVEASDEEGHDLIDMTAAQELAIRSVREFLGHEVMRGKLDLRGQIDIADEGRRILASIPFVDVLTIVWPQEQSED